jgi:hypothetical protein
MDFYNGDSCCCCSDCIGIKLFTLLFINFICILFDSINKPAQLGLNFVIQSNYREVNCQTFSLHCKEI